MSQQIQDAKDALHNLMMGRSVVSIQKDGRSVQYTATTKRDLEAYINYLEQNADSSKRRRPAGVY